jgi:hypothetical protein
VGTPCAWGGCFGSHKPGPRNDVKQLKIKTMATLRNGLLGNYKGKIGNLVFYEVRGRQVVRTLGKSTVPPTPAQLQNRNEMETVVGFLKPLREFINVGFNLKAKGSSRTPYNMAVSYNKIHAVAGAYPNVKMNYEKVQVTEGRMVAAINPTVELTADGLSFTWLCPDTLEWPRPNDQVMLLAYFPLLERVGYILYGANRLECADVLNLPTDLLGKYMEVYISFIAENRQKIANSIYLGNFNQ